MIYELKDGRKAAALFEGWAETLIWSCLQGVMGHLYADDLEQPHSAMAVLGDFCFFAGVPRQEMIAFRPSWCRQDFMILVPQDDRWAMAIREFYKGRAKKVVRYATKKEPETFDRDRLKEMVRLLPSQYVLRRMDEELYKFCRKKAWSRDLVSQFADYAIYREKGLGVMILKDGLPVSGASSYAVYSGGIEIEIGTRKKYRKKGLASVCGASLILECLDRGLYPSWDAQNPRSAALAQKLGYDLAYEYQAYEIEGYSNA